MTREEIEQYLNSKGIMMFGSFGGYNGKDQLEFKKGKLYFYEPINQSFKYNDLTESIINDNLNMLK